MDTSHWRLFVLISVLSVMPLGLLASSSVVNVSVEVVAQNGGTNSGSGSSGGSSGGSSSGASGGGGGGGVFAAISEVVSVATTTESAVSIPSQVVFQGAAYSFGKIALLQDGIIVWEGVANAQGRFEATLQNLKKGSYLFGFSGRDSAGIASPFLAYPVTIVDTTSRIVGTIVLPPTISGSVQADQIVARGYTLPGAILDVTTKGSRVASTARTIADAEGKWEFTKSKNDLQAGTHAVRVRARGSTDQALFSDTIFFTITAKGDILNQPELQKGLSLSLRSDVNDDGRVNIVDFSILAFWYRKKTVPAALDLTGDKKVDLADLSILAYYWTG